MTKWRRELTGGLCALLVGMAVGCDGGVTTVGSELEQQHVQTGRVLEFRQGKAHPVAGATVHVSGQSVSTDPHGFWVARTADASPRSLIASAPGRAPVATSTDASSRDSVYETLLYVPEARREFETGNDGAMLVYDHEGRPKMQVAVRSKVAFDRNPLELLALAATDPADHDLLPAVAQSPSAGAGTFMPLLMVQVAAAGDEGDQLADSGIRTDIQVRMPTGTENRYGSAGTEALWTLPFGEHRWRRTGEAQLIEVGGVKLFSFAAQNSGWFAVGAPVTAPACLEVSLPTALRGNGSYWLLLQDRSLVQASRFRDGVARLSWQQGRQVSLWIGDGLRPTAEAAVAAGPLPILFPNATPDGTCTQAFVPVAGEQHHIAGRVVDASGLALTAGTVALAGAGAVTRIAADGSFRFAPRHLPPLYEDLILATAIAVDGQSWQASLPIAGGQPLSELVVAPRALTGPVLQSVRFSNTSPRPGEVIRFEIGALVDSMEALWTLLREPEVVAESPGITLTPSHLGGSAGAETSDTQTGPIGLAPDSPWAKVSLSDAPHVVAWEQTAPAGAGLFAATLSGTIAGPVLPVYETLQLALEDDTARLQRQMSLRWRNSPAVVSLTGPTLFATGTPAIFTIHAVDPDRDSAEVTWSVLGESVAVSQLGNVLTLRSDVAQLATISVRVQDAERTVQTLRSVAILDPDDLGHSRAHAPDTFVGSDDAIFAQVAELDARFRSNRDDADFECDLNDGGYLPCSSPWKATGLAEGVNLLKVRAVAGGLIDTSPAYQLRIVDLVRPDTTAFPPFVTVSVGETFEAQLAGTDNWGVEQFACRAAESDYIACAQHLTVGPIENEGVYSLKVVAVDFARNWDQSPAEIVIHVVP